MIRSFVLLSALLAFAACPSGVLAQAPTGSVVSGRVGDAETGVSLADAIIFIVNSSIGASSDAAGRFSLEFAPPGESDIVVSRIGYVRRIIHFTLKESDSLSLDVRLVPQPVSVKGVDILGQSGGEAGAGPFLFFPAPSAHSYSVYGRNSSLPIGILFTDSALYMCALDTAVIDSGKYVRLWMLYKNLTAEPEDFNPAAAVKLKLSARERTYGDIASIVPAEMMALVPKRTAMAQFAVRIQATIDALLLIHQLIQPGYIRSIHQNIDAREGTDADRSGKMRTRWNLGKYPALMGTTTEYLSKIFQSSVHAGILKQYTVYPDNCVDGFVYFPFPGLGVNTSGAGFGEALQYHYELDILTPSGRKTIVFTAN